MLRFSCPCFPTALIEVQFTQAKAHTKVVMTDGMWPASSLGIRGPGQHFQGAGFLGLWTFRHGGLRALEKHAAKQAIKTHPSTTDLQAITTNRLGNFCRLALQEASILMETPKGYIFSPPRPPKRAEATAFSAPRAMRRKLPTKRRNIRGIERTRTPMTRRTTKGSHQHRQTSHLLVC